MIFEDEDEMEIEDLMKLGDEEAIPPECN